MAVHGPSSDYVCREQSSNVGLSGGRKWATPLCGGRGLFPHQHTRRDAKHPSACSAQVGGVREACLVSRCSPRLPPHTTADGEFHPRPQQVGTKRHAGLLHEDAGTGSAISELVRPPVRATLLHSAVTAPTRWRARCAGQCFSQAGRHPSAVPANVEPPTPVSRRRLPLRSSCEEAPPFAWRCLQAVAKQARIRTEPSVPVSGPFPVPRKSSPCRSRTCRPQKCHP